MSTLSVTTPAPAINMSDLIGNETIFPILKHWDFFNHAGVCPLPKPAADAIRLYASQAEASAYLDNGWYNSIEQLRIASAQLINAHRDEIAFIKNTSEGISIVAHGIDWQWGDKIVTTNVEYPANIYPWMEVVRSRGVKLVQVEEEAGEHGARSVPVEKILAAADDPHTK